MEHADVNHSVNVAVEPKISENVFLEENQISTSNMDGKSCMESSHEVHILSEKAFCLDKNKGAETLDKGYLKFGCSHYRRRCKIRAPCCDEIFDCRHCHNEAKNHIGIDQKLRHDIPRLLIEKVICSLCGAEQGVQQVCISCGVCMGRYYCGVCKLFDDDISKDQFHCNGCGICRTGGSENFSHCYKCGCCYSIEFENSHPCVEKAMHQDCPVCFEYLFDSTNDVICMLCGHTIHKICLEEMQKHNRYNCPICFKSLCDMSNEWEKLDLEIAATPMPSCYRDKMVWILCNDCGSKSEVKYHVVGQKCPNCKSYNTCQTRGVTGHS